MKSHRKAKEIPSWGKWLTRLTRKSQRKATHFGVRFPDTWLTATGMALPWPWHSALVPGKRVEVLPRLASPKDSKRRELVGLFGGYP